LICPLKYNKLYSDISALYWIPYTLFLVIAKTSRAHIDHDNMTMSEYTRNIVERVNYGMPHHTEAVYDDYIAKIGFKKEYYTFPTNYGNHYRIIALNDRTFVVEAGGGMGYFKAKTWNEAVGLRTLMVNRHRQINRLMS
jgi:hypothetical protein